MLGGVNAGTQLSFSLLVDSKSSAHGMGLMGMTSCCQRQPDRILASLSSERLHPAEDGNRCRDPQPNIRWCSSLVEELREGLRDLKRTGTPQEDQQSQLTWTLRGSQRLNHQPKSMHGLDQGPLAHIYQTCSLVFKQVPQQLEMGLSLNLLPACGSHFPNWAALSGLSGRGCT